MENRETTEGRIMTTETFTPEPLMSSSLAAQGMRRKKTEDVDSYFGDRIKRAEGKTTQGKLLNLTRNHLDLGLLLRR